MKAEDMKKFNQLQIQLRPLFFLQEKLDQKIASRFEYDDFLRQEHYAKVILGFRTELGELLNALRLHKYWSQQKPESKERILEEYADGLHMLLSIGGKKDVKDYTYRGIYDGEITGEDLVFLFDKLITMPWMDLRKDDYLLGLEMYLKLGDLLLFNWDEIKQAYTLKNIENIERQEKGY